MENFTKTVRIGTSKESGSTFCKIKWLGDRLSITGVEGPRKDGNCRGGCGQIEDHIQVDTFAPGWSASLLEHFVTNWKRWHLNDCTAGSPEQEEYLRLNPVSYTYPDSHYEAACKVLKEAGIQPDMGHKHNDKPYSYGSAWLFEEVPADVLEFFKGLPNTDRIPAWV